MPNVEDLKFSALNFDNKCKHLKDNDKEHTTEAKQHILDLIIYCRKIRPHVYFHKQQIQSLNETAHHILKN